MEDDGHVWWWGGGLGCDLLKVSRKTRKKHRFLTLFAKRRAKRSKNALFSHFLRTLYKVSRKM